MLCRVAEDAEFTAASTGGQISSRLLSMRSANALLELPAVSALSPVKSLAFKASEICRLCDARMQVQLLAMHRRGPVRVQHDSECSIFQTNVGFDDTHVCEVCKVHSRTISHFRGSPDLDVQMGQVQGTLPAGSVVSALLIGDLRAMPVPEEVTMLDPFQSAQR